MLTHDFCCYILTITRNQNIFTPEMKEPITDHLVLNAKNIYIYTWLANGKKRENPMRREYQDVALDSIKAFYLHWLLAKKIFHLKEKRNTKVMKDLKEIETTIKKWINDDISRCAETSENVEGRAT